jgi:hypothetical protein
MALFRLLIGVMAASFAACNPCDNPVGFALAGSCSADFDAKGEVFATVSRDVVSIEWSANDATNVAIVRSESRHIPAFTGVGDLVPGSAIDSGAVLVAKSNNTSGRTVDEDVPEGEFDYQVWMKAPTRGFADDDPDWRLGPAASVVIDLTAPAFVDNFEATMGDDGVRLAWTNPTEPDFAGVLIARYPGVADSFAEPERGISYLTGEALGEGVVVFSGGSGQSTALDDDAPEMDVTYAIWSRDYSLNWGARTARVVTQESEL